MAKRGGVPMNAKNARKYDDWEVSDAMHTMMRAKEIEGDPEMMKRVRKRAAEHAQKMEGVARDAAKLAGRGLISDKQMAKLKNDKPIAKGNEGDKGQSQTVRGVVTT